MCVDATVAKRNVATVATGSVATQLSWQQDDGNGEGWQSMERTIAACARGREGLSVLQNRVEHTVYPISHRAPGSWVLRTVYRTTTFWRKWFMCADCRTVKP